MFFTLDIDLTDHKSSHLLNRVRFKPVKRIGHKREQTHTHHVKLTTQFQLVSKLQLREVMPPFPCMSV
jgi:hypothetical protein